MKFLMLVVLFFQTVSVCADIPGGTQPPSLGFIELVLTVLFIVITSLGVIYLRDKK